MENSVSHFLHRQVKKTTQFTGYNKDRYDRKDRFARNDRNSRRGYGNGKGRYEKRDSGVYGKPKDKNNVTSYGTFIGKAEHKDEE